METNTILSKIENEVRIHLEKNKLKINRFVRKYSNVKMCFYSDDENGELYEFLFDISHEYGIPEEEVYYCFVEAKYTTNGELANAPEENFAAKITVCETIKN